MRPRCTQRHRLLPIDEIDHDDATTPDIADAQQSGQASWLLAIGRCAACTVADPPGAVIARAASIAAKYVP